MYLKKFSQACENNKQPIAVCLEAYLRPLVQQGPLAEQDFSMLDSSQINKCLSPSVLEIGSGTGQHGCYFCKKFPEISWQPTDIAENLPGIEAWVKEAELENLKDPIRFDVDHPKGDEFYDKFIMRALSLYSHIYTANTLHIMSWESVMNFFQWIPKLLQTQGLLFIYGPFKFKGSFTTASNERFDGFLKQKAPHQGIRDFEAIEILAAKFGLVLHAKHDLPANNHLLVWMKQQAA